jgi:Ca-activated chloride channel family protein
MIWLLLPLLFGLVLAERRSQQKLLRLLPDDPYRNRTGARLLPDILILIALALILLSLQSKQLTTLDNRPAPAIALVVDVSYSMQVADVQPNRLTLAKRELLALVNNLSDARFALIPFAGEAVLQVPLTSDHAGLKFFINNLHPGLIDSKGSAP